MKKLVVNNELEVVDDILIVKVGSNTLISKEDVKRGEINQKSFDVIGDQLKRQRELGRKIIVVSSAAISAGMIETGTKIRPDKEIKENLPELQRLAASGWRTITNLWDDTLSPINTSNILFTRRELEFKKERKKLLDVTRFCLEKNDIIISNENDAISTDEIVNGDNDTISAGYAKVIGESSLFGSNIKLILLTDVDGMLEDANDSSTLIPVVNNVIDCITFANDTNNENGSGGMISKLDAYQITKSAGIDMWIANGKNPNAIEMALNGETGTYFPAAA